MVDRQVLEEAVLKWHLTFKGDWISIWRRQGRNLPVRAYCTKVWRALWVSPDNSWVHSQSPTMLSSFGLI